ncbi:MAG: LysR family transcriptional regulator, partial [Sulfitobacter sp.]|nr:LysR family transcriptional regulator [Sulfitobacter sp.]
MQISGSDIHLLSVFDSVVRNNGFSAAQAELGLSQPTISNHITALEQRLGVKLCQRGRRGFLLTEKGQMVHGIAQSLIANLDEHSAQLTALKGGLIGTIRLAVVDSLATDPNLKLPEAIRAMTEMAPSVRL